MSPSNPPASLSVTKVRVAFECPRLMYLGHHENSMMMFRASNTAIGGVGSAFHKLCDDCVDVICRDDTITQLLVPAAPQLNPKELAQKIQKHLYSTVFFPLVQSTISTNPSKVPALNQLWEGITGLIQRWAELLASNRKFCQPADVIRKTFLAQELSVKFDFQLPDGSSQLVKGRFDSLVYDFAAQRLCVVEYKTYQATDPAAQLAQVALYSYMLQQKLQVNINSAVYSVLPDWKGVEYAWDLLEKSLHQLIPPKLQQMRSWLAWQPSTPNPPPMTAHPELCNICPQRSKCPSYFATDGLEAPDVDSTSESALLKEVPPLVTGAIAQGFALDYSQPVKVETLQVESRPVSSIEVEPQPPKNDKPQSPFTSNSRNTANTTAPLPSLSPTHSPTHKQNVSDDVAHQLVEVLQSFNVGVDYLGSALGPAFMRVKLKPHLGVRVSSILKFEDDIRVHLGLANPPLMAPQAGFISVDLPRPDRQTAFFSDYFQQPKKNLPKIKAAIGINLDGELVEADLSDPNTCHFLVGGTTGSGKSEFLRSLLLSLIVRHDPAYFQVALVDPKRVTFPEFENMRWLYEPVVKTKEDAISLMERLVVEMEDRYNRFERSRCSSLTAYNKKASTPLPRILCIFDEYADFMADKETAKALEQSIQRLGAMARAAGIHLIIATQRPEARVVTPLIRSNLPGRVALRTASDADSAIILGGKHGEAANLLGKGDLFYDGSGTLQRLQSLFAPPETVMNLIC